MLGAALQGIKNIVPRLFAGGAGAAGRSALAEATEAVSVKAANDAVFKKGVWQGVKDFFSGNKGTLTLGVMAEESTRRWWQLKDGANAVLPLALLAGLVGGAYLFFKGGDTPKTEEGHAPSAPKRAPALTPQQQLLQPQTAMPLGNMTTAHPAAVGTMAPMQAQSAPQANWAARVGQRPQQPTVAMAPQESYLQAEQARAEQAALMQNNLG